MLAGRRQRRRADHRRRHHRRDARAAAGRAGPPGRAAGGRRDRQRHHRQLHRQPLRDAQPAACATIASRWGADVARQVVQRSAARPSTSSRRAASSCRTWASAAAPLSVGASSPSQQDSDRQGVRRAAQAARLPAWSAQRRARHRCPRPLGDVLVLREPGAVPAAGLRGARWPARRPRRGAQLHEHSRVLELDAKAKRARPPPPARCRPARS